MADEFLHSDLVSALDSSALTESILAHVLDQVPYGAFTLNPSLECVYVNAAFLTMCGLTADEVVGQSHDLLIGEHSNADVVASLRGSLARGESFRGQIASRRSTGESFLSFLSTFPLRDAAGVITHFVFFQRDCSAEVAGEQRIENLLRETIRQRETATTLLNVSRQMNQFSTVRGVASASATAVISLTGCDRSSIVLWDSTTEIFTMIGMDGWDTNPGTPAQYLQTMVKLRPEVTAILRANAPVLITKDTGAWAQEVLATYGVEVIGGVPLVSGGEPRGILFATWVETPPPESLAQWVSEHLTGLASLTIAAIERAQVVEVLNWNSTHDALTKLPNRNLTKELLLASLTEAAAGRHEVAVIYGNLDRFKRTNRLLGHDAGDELLKHVAATLQSAVGDEATVGRSNGDEFVLVLPVIAGVVEAYDTANRIERMLAEPMRLREQDVIISISLGISISDKDLHPDQINSDLAANLIDCAMQAMHHVKSTKRGTSSPAGIDNELQLDADLHGAVERGEITVFFQPQVDLTTNEICAVEALARWQHPLFGYISPTDFIPLAENNGVIGDVGLFVLESACQLGASLRGRGFELGVSVNVSASQLATKKFFTRLETVLATTGMLPELLTLEITESTAVSNQAAVRKQLEKLRLRSIGISVDDFGTGYSSLAQLHQLPVSELKIDKSFVRNEFSVGRALITAVVTLSAELGLRVVAEGVETESQLQMLKELDCERGQGYLLGRAMTAAELETLLTSAR